MEANVKGAEVFVDGSLQGLTDSHERYEQQKINVGLHQVTVKKSGFEDSSQQVDIAKDTRFKAVFSLREKKEIGGKPKPGEGANLLVQTGRAGAQVFIDGQFKGTADADGNLLRSLDPGPHQVEAKLAGYEPGSRGAAAVPGKQVAVSVELREIPKPKPIISVFTSSASTIQLGQSVRLNWSTENADELSIDPIGSVEASTEVSPTKNTRYTLIAKGPGGTARSESVTVAVSAPPSLKASIDQFKAAPPSIQAGESTTLFWITQHADNVSLDPGIGIVAAGDSQQVTPLQTTVYTLTAKGPGGDAVKQSVTVTVRDKQTVTAGSSDPKECIDHYRDAYEARDITALIGAWPALASDSKRQTAIEETFRRVESITLQLLCHQPTFVTGETTHFQCTETMIYKISGSSLKPLKNSVELVCKRIATGWVVQDHVVK